MNSPCLETIVSSVLAGLLIVATILIAFNQYRQQKKIQEENLLLNRESRILGIYNAFVDSERILSRWFSGVDFKQIVSSSYEQELMNLREQQAKINAACNEAKLIFEDGSVIVQRLEYLFEKFNKFCEKKEKLIASLKENLYESFDILRQEFPDLEIESMCDLDQYPDAMERFWEIVDSKSLNDFAKEIKKFLKDDFSDEGLGNFFKPYINRIK